jgi:hypothetical protein
VGTLIRFLFGLIGAYLMVGNAKTTTGYILFLTVGFFLYTFSIRQGVLFTIFDCNFDGWIKYGVRFVSAILFVIGYKDVKEN